VSGPKVIAGGDRDGFRLVRIEEGDRISHILEVPDGCDALGVERWREFQLNSSHLKTIFGFFIKLALQQQPQEK
jgi:hypothetical protein